jgi:hypothetical protein
MGRLSARQLTISFVAFDNRDGRFHPYTFAGRQTPGQPPVAKELLQELRNAGCGHDRMFVIGPEVVVHFQDRRRAGVAVNFLPLSII